MNASEYRAFLKQTRRTQLQRTIANEQRVIRVLEAAAEDVRAKVLTYSDEISQGVYGSLLTDIEARLSVLKSDFSKALTAGRFDLAQLSVEAQAQVLEGSGVEVPVEYGASDIVQFTLSTGEKIEQSYGIVAARAMERTANRVYSNGYKLFGILENLDVFGREQVQDLIVQGVAEGMAANQLAQHLYALFTEQGLDTPFYRALRIARTEINTAYQEAHLQSLVNPQTGGVFDFAEGVRWNLSLSHPKPDICDVWAAHDDGKGAGVYHPNDVPSRHPNCLCYLTTVLKVYPDVTAPVKEPNTADVPDSMVLYWAESGDVPAQALLVSREGVIA
jgi:hypothetical protein